LLQCFLAALAKVPNDVSRHMCLKQMSSVLIENDNINVIFNTSGDLQKLLLGMYNFTLNITNTDDLSLQSKQYYDTYLFQKHISVTESEH